MKKKRLIVIFINSNKKLNVELMCKQMNDAFKNANVNIIVTIIAKTIFESNNIIIKILN